VSKSSRKIVRRSDLTRNTMLAGSLHSRIDRMSARWSSLHRTISAPIHREMDDSRLRRAEVAPSQRDNASRSCARDTCPHATPSPLASKGEGGTRAAALAASSESLDGHRPSPYNTARPGVFAALKAVTGRAIASESRLQVLQAPSGDWRAIINRLPPLPSFPMEDLAIGL